MMDVSPTRYLMLTKDSNESGSATSVITCSNHEYIRLSKSDSLLPSIVLHAAYCTAIVSSNFYLFGGLSSKPEQLSISPLGSGSFYALSCLYVELISITYIQLCCHYSVYCYLIFDAS